MHELTSDVPRRTDASPLLLFLPAMGVPASFYAPFVERLRRRRFDAVVVDLPGQGQSPLRARLGDDYGYREVVEDQVPGALSQLAQRHPGRPLLLGGHSLGGQLAVLASHDVQERVQGLVLRSRRNRTLARLAAGQACPRSADRPCDRRRGPAAAMVPGTPPGLRR